MKSKYIVLISIILGLLTLMAAYSNYGSPSEFGNETATTAWIGGDKGELNITGSADIEGNVTASWFKGLFNWTTSTASNIWLSFTGSELSFNETHLNNTIDARAVAGEFKYYPSEVDLTSGTYNGSLVSDSKIGYDAGNAICDAEFSNSHLCNEFEIMNWFANEDSPAVTGDAWCSAGGPKYVPADHPVSDCDGFTSSGVGATDPLGNYWHFNQTTGGEGRALNCQTNLKLACCTY